MKRITFKDEFVPLILSGEKTMTQRWFPIRVSIGDLVAAVTAEPGKPAFLTPAAEAFAVLKVTDYGFSLIDDEELKLSVSAMAYAQCGFQSESEAFDFYKDNRPLGAYTLHRVEFELVHPGPPRRNYDEM